MKNNIQITCTCLCFFAANLALISVSNARTTDIASTEVSHYAERVYSTPDILAAGIPVGTADRPLLTSDGNDLEPIGNAIPAVEFVPTDFHHCLQASVGSSHLLTGLLGLMLLGLVLLGVTSPRKTY